MSMRTAFAFALASSLVAACSSAAPPDARDDADASAPTTDVPGGGELGGTGPSGPDPSCATATYRATKAPLALLIMLDRSDSMLSATATGVSKWAAAKGALESFLATTASSSTTVALSYFPRRAPGIPDSCTADAQCGLGGRCGPRLCLQEGPPKECSSSAECGGAPCVSVGKCTLSDELCLPSSAGACGVAGGTCRRWCTNETACRAEDYATPAVSFTPAGKAGVAIASSLASIAPFGNTPTAPALAGALETAERALEDDPGAAAAVVLVTDGLPTDCGLVAPSQIAQIASAGRTRGVRTFVVGLFAPEEAAEARSNLDAIAAGGGTGNAVLVTTGAKVALELAAALEDARDRAVPCEYALPVPAGGGVVDPAEVNVVVTPDGLAASTIPRVADARSCAGDPGWHYAGDAAAPSKIVLCPETCDALTRPEAVKVDIVTGCKTVVR